NSMVGISSDKAEYGKRQKVDLAIKPGQSNIAANNFSVSVFQVDSLQSSDDDIASYLWLSSDLRGFVESPGYYFSGEDKTGEAIDGLLMTHGWRRFRWEK